MKKKKFIIVILVFILVGGFLFLVITGLGKQKLASLMVESNLISAVFIDGKKVGETPYIGTYEAKEVVIGVGSYQTRVHLQPGIKTVIVRDFDNSKIDSSGEIIYFEKIGGSETSMVVVTSPDLATVTLDSVSRGFAPTKIDGLTSGTHHVSIAVEGYITRNFSINLVPGYKLITVVDLSLEASKEKQVVQNTEDLNQVFVKILSTPNGFLRVRSLPTTASDEIGQVRPGEKYQLIKTDDKTGWYNVQLTATNSGWISNTYAVQGIK